MNLQNYFSIMTDALTDLLNNLPVRKARKPPGPPMPAHCKQRYQQAHEGWFKLKYPQAYDANNYSPPTMPPCNKSNGMQRAIINFLTWHGHRATRISSSGRFVNGKWIPGPTRKGAADVSSTIKINGIGMSVMWEIKINKDTASEFQLREQKLEEAAGGKYFFVKTFDEFITKYDSL